MKDQSPFFVSPNPVPVNASINIQFSGVSFNPDSYYITNENGATIRKGKIIDAARNFSLSVRGMPDGTYWLIMGD
ncbi:MAG: hypothetical protein JNK98_07400, partial [Chitinophagaceae bacterium]|nr:hypothetical protein [Chitinophagaceae bacterium]